MEEILKEFPRSEYKKYGDFLELRLRIENGEGCYKINGTLEQVKEAVRILILKHNIK